MVDLNGYAIPLIGDNKEICFVDLIKDINRRESSYMDPAYAVIETINTINFTMRKTPIFYWSDLYHYYWNINGIEYSIGSGGNTGITPTIQIYLK